MQLSRTWERGDTQANAASAEQLPSLLGKLPSESSFQFGKFVVVRLLLKIKKSSNRLKLGEMMTNHVTLKGCFYRSGTEIFLSPP
jgi:hypothetical protein